MSELNVVPQMLERISQLQRDIAELKRRQLPAFAESGLSSVLPLVFSFPGGVANNVESAPWFPPPTASIVFAYCRVSVTTPGTGTTTIELRVDGSPLTSVNLPSGDSTVLSPISISLTNDVDFDLDFLTVKTTAVGTGVADLSVELSPTQ